MLLSARRWKTFAALRAGTPASGPTHPRISNWLLLSTATRTTHERVRLAKRGAPRVRNARRLIGCVAAGMGVTLLPRAVVERSELCGAVRVHALRSEQRRIDTLFIHRRTIHVGCALRSFLSCLKNGKFPA